MRRNKMRMSVNKLKVNGAIFIIASLGLFLIAGLVFLSKEITPKIEPQSIELKLSK